MANVVSDPAVLAKRIDALRTELLMDEGGDTVLSPRAEQYFLLALSALEQAKSFMVLADYASMREE